MDPTWRLKDSEPGDDELLRCPVCDGGRLLIETGDKHPEEVDCMYCFGTGVITQKEWDKMRLEVFGDGDKVPY